MQNLPTLDQIAADPEIVVNLPMDALDALLSSADAAAKTSGAAKKAIIGHIETANAAEIALAFAGLAKDTGTVHVMVDGYELEVNRPKKVEWDQVALAATVAKIRDAGDDPSEYVKTTFTVDERAYQAWPSFIRSQFEPARTVKVGTPTLKLKPAQAEAA